MSLARALVAEALGTAFLLLAVVGSGIMAQRLCGGNIGLALLANAIATGAALTVLIRVFAPLSGAHFNPAVSLYFALQSRMPWRTAFFYAPVQAVAAILGVWTAHVLFGTPIWEVSRNLRPGAGLLLSEFVASFGLLLTIAGTERLPGGGLAASVGLYITGAYWFTASTSFANPAVTLARAFTGSFAGIAPVNVAGFVAAQLLAAAIAAIALPRLLVEPEG